MFSHVLGHYYFKKYPMNYSVKRNDGNQYLYFTIPVKTLVGIYKEKMGEEPKSFFDCGCAVGELLRQGEELGLSVHGIDVSSYPIHNKKQQEQNVEIVSILDYTKPINYDIAFCNGTLTYLDEKTIEVALGKLKASKLLIAIHNTTEDDQAAGCRLSTADGRRLVKSQKWWLDKFKQVGFDAEYDLKSGCFLARSQGRERA